MGSVAKKGDNPIKNGMSGHPMLMPVFEYHKCIQTEYKITELIWHVQTEGNYSYSFLARIIFTVSVNVIIIIH
jgi:hypothetical protein